MTIRERLFGLEQFGIKLGLSNIGALLEALGRPERAYPTVHIAGTNGKGSVAAMVERALRAAGHRTGRYTSPHLARIEERFAIDGRPLTPFAFDAIALDVLHAVDAGLASGALEVTPTFFEVTTAIAFEAFRRAKAGAGVIEVGLGGRFDATNVLEPLVTAVTSIDFDHERHLGTTLSAIAFEKAGIAKHRVPMVLGALAAEPRQVITVVAEACGAPVVDAALDSTMMVSLSHGRATVSIRTPSRDYPPTRLALAGRHQAGNALVAVRILEVADAAGLAVPASAVIAGLTGAEWPARLEWLHLPDHGELLIDAAHNPSGARSLASYVDDAGVGPLPVVIAAMHDKNLSAMVEALAPVASRWIATAAASARSRTAPQIAGEIARMVRSEVGWHADPLEAVADALARHPRAIAAGSIYMVGPLRAALLARGAMLSSEWDG